MQAGVGLLVTDVMPIYMIMPRYSHNYALFYQLLDSNLFTHRNTYAILREATSETYGPRVYSHHINLHHFYIVLLFTLPLLFTLHLYTKNTKNKVLSNTDKLWATKQGLLFCFSTFHKKDLFSFLETVPF